MMYRGYQYILIAFAFTLAICSTACTAIITNNPQTSISALPPASSSANLPASTSLPSANSQFLQSGKLIFTDDFSDPSSGWATFSDDQGEAKYGNSHFTLKCTKSGRYIKTINNKIPLQSRLAVDIDVLMASGKGDDCVGIIIGYPNFNTMNDPGIVRPSNYWFRVCPARPSAEVYSFQPDLEYSGREFEPSGLGPGRLLSAKNYACITGPGTVNNIKISVNPDIRFSLNNTELLNASDDGNLDFVNRLIRDKTIEGASITIFGISYNAYPTTLINLNRIKVYDN